jgi:colicin import membrane protein
VIENPLAVIETTPEYVMTIFTTQGGTKEIVDKIKKQVESEVFDVTTPKGRERIGSVARQIGSSKKRLEEAAMAITEDWRTKTNLVNAEKKYVSTELDLLRDAVLAPRVAFENLEKQRVEEHECMLSRIVNSVNFPMVDPPVDFIESSISSVSNIFERDWQEYLDKASQAYKKTMDYLRTALTARIKRDADNAELERLRKEQEERQKKEHEEMIARQAAEAARIAAEEKAALELKASEEAAAKQLKAVEDARLEAEQKAAQAEQQRIEADEKAKLDAAAAEAKRLSDIKVAEEKAKSDLEAAIQAERERLAAKERMETEELARREADQKHRGSINRTALSDLMTVANLTEEQGKAVIEAIAKGLISNIKINY